MEPVKTFAFPSRQIKKQADYVFTFSSNNQWTVAPQGRQKLTLAEPRMVGIGYNIQVTDTDQKFLCTRVLINDKQYNQLSSTTGSVRYHSHNIFQLVPLQPGQYKIELQYRTNGKIINQNPLSVNHHKISMIINY